MTQIQTISNIQKCEDGMRFLNDTKMLQKDNKQILHKYDSYLANTVCKVWHLHTQEKTIGYSKQTTDKQQNSESIISKKATPHFF